MNAAPTTDLSRYDEACRALAEAKTIFDVMPVHDASRVLQAAARAAKNKELEWNALELRVKATRRIGLLMRDQLASGDRVGAGRPPQNGVADTPLTLEAQGVDKNLAKHARILAALTDEAFATLIAQSRDAMRQAGSKIIRKTGEQEEIDGRLAEDVRSKVRGTPLDAPIEHEYLASLSEDEQRAVIAELMNDERAEPDEVELAQLTDLVTAWNIANDQVRRIFMDRQLGVIGEARSFGELEILLDKARKRRNWSMEELNGRADLPERHANKLLIHNPSSAAKKRLGPKSAAKVLRALGATIQLRLGALPQDDADQS